MCVQPTPTAAVRPMHLHRSTLRPCFTVYRLPWLTVLKRASIRLLQCHLSCTVAFCTRHVDKRVKLFSRDVYASASAISRVSTPGAGRTTRRLSRPRVFYQSRFRFGSKASRPFFDRPRPFVPRVACGVSKPRAARTLSSSKYSSVTGTSLPRERRRLRTSRNIATGTPKARQSPRKATPAPVPPSATPAAGAFAEATVVGASVTLGTSIGG